MCIAFLLSCCICVASSEKCALCGGQFLAVVPAREQVPIDIERMAMVERLRPAERLSRLGHDVPWVKA